jgi:hypothetical protein
VRTILVRYKTTPAHASANEAAIHAVFDELRAKTPAGLRYTSFRGTDPGTFFHLATIDAAENPLLTLPSFVAFQKQLQGHFVEPPVTTELAAVDAYGQVMP